MKWTLGGSAVVLSLSLSACTGARIQDDDGVDNSGVNDREGEACTAFAEERACGQHDEGVQYCGWEFEASDLHTWGVCLTDTECELGEQEACDGDAVRACELDAREPAWGDCVEPVEPEGGDTPLVLVFPGDEIEYRAAGTARFSIGGSCTTHDWPTATTPWLAIDLDRNGSIDGGHELFGSGTVLGNGARAEHGFAALAELDANGDGLVSPSDPRFAEIVLWSDHDGDRRSTRWEEESLASRGIMALPVAFAIERTCDARGNCAVEHAAVEMQSDSATVVASLVDVHLACQ
jgi:hypothetical protein